MLINTLGVGAYFLVLGLIAMEIALFKRQSVQAPWLKTAGWTLSLIGLTTLASMTLPDRLFSPLIGPGGYMGALGNGILGNYFGAAGSLIITVSLLMTGMMVWTEYLVFRAGRLAFSPAIVAATAVMPFGLMHGFVNWFNGSKSESSLAKHDIEEFEDEEEELEDEAPRTIRFRRRDLEETETEDSEAVVAQVDDEDDEELEEEEYDDDEAEEPTTIKISAAEDVVADEETETETETEADEKEEVVAVAPLIPKPHFKMPRKKPAPEKPPTERELVINQLNEAVSNEDLAEYELPGLEMLDRGNSVPFERQKRDALQKAEILEKTCKEFNYDVRVVEIETGPVISQYEIELAPGLRLNKITSLADDLAIAMRVPSVRIVAPIPGKNSVGVEVPNEHRQVVHLRQLMEQSEKEIKKMKIPLFLGADAVGAPLVADLAELPHPFDCRSNRNW